MKTLDLSYQEYFGKHPTLQKKLMPTILAMVGIVVHPYTYLSFRPFSLFLNPFTELIRPKKLNNNTRFAAERPTTGDLGPNCPNVETGGLGGGVGVGDLGISDGVGLLGDTGVSVGVGGTGVDVGGTGVAVGSTGVGVGGTGVAVGGTDVSVGVAGVGVTGVGVTGVGVTGVGMTGIGVGVSVGVGVTVGVSVSVGVLVGVGVSVGVEVGVSVGDGVGVSASRASMIETFASMVKIGRSSAALTWSTVAIMRLACLDVELSIE